MTAPASSAWVSASREPREPMRTSTAQPPFVEPEQAPDRLGVGLAAAVGGRLLHPHRRLVQELVQDLRRDHLEPLALLLGKRPELRELGRADLLGAGAQRRDRRHDVERGAPLAEALGLLDDEPLGDLGLGAAAVERLGDDRLEVVDVVEVAAVELVHGRIDVARDRDVDEEERPAAACGDIWPASIRRPGAAVEVSTTSTSPSRAATSSSASGCPPKRAASSAAPSALRFAT